MKIEIRPFGMVLLMSLSVFANDVADGLSGFGAAAFDHGGTTFNLESISKERFSLPAGGQSGCMERLSLLEPENPLVITADWAEARKKFQYPVRLSFRYRLRADRLGPSERIFTKVKFYIRKKDGSRVKGQPDWQMKAYDT